MLLVGNPLGGDGSWITVTLRRTKWARIPKCAARADLTAACCEISLVSAPHEARADIMRYIMNISNKDMPLESHVQHTCEGERRSRADVIRHVTVGPFPGVHRPTGHRVQVVLPAALEKRPGSHGKQVAHAASPQ